MLKTKFTLSVDQSRPLFAHLDPMINMITSDWLEHGSQSAILAQLYINNDRTIEISAVVVDEQTGAKITGLVDAFKNKSEAIS